MNNSTQLSSTDKALQKVADLIIERMEALKSAQWSQPWFNNNYQGIARNFSGRSYNGMNSFILDLFTSMKGHELPVFMTFNQAKKEGLHINKGAHSVPVFYGDVVYKDEKGRTVSEAELSQMSKEEIAELDKRFFVKKYDVFNVSDTNLKELKPDVFTALLKEYSVKKLPDTQGMYSNPALDRMFKEQEWLCPIELKPGSKAFYRPSTDSITLPLKEQFKKGTSAEEVYRSGMEFYSTALHEMAHSTGSSERLNREGGKKFGDKKYAKEELVAELTAATVSQQLGFDKHVTDNSAMYLSNWVKALKEEPKFIYTVLSEVGKAQGLIMEEIEKQSQHLTKKLPEATSAMEMLSQTAIKAKIEYPDTLILVRHGQNYELYNKDAEIASKVLGISTAQHLQKVTENPLLLASFNREQLDTFLPQLVKADNRVAIVDPKIEEVNFVKLNNGDFAVRAKVMGDDTGLLPIDRERATQYINLPSLFEKESFLKSYILDNYNPPQVQSLKSYGHKI